MSKFSGKCDLYDHMMMLKTQQKGNVYVSDEWECFNEFKRKTKGVLYQHYKVRVTINNQKFVSEHCKDFAFVTHTISKPDKRSKSGEKNYTYYTYEYYNRQYNSLQELNKHGVYITVEVHFDTLLDLIPYYPYIITCMFSDNEKETVFISNESFVRSEFYEGLQYGYISQLNYNKVLQEHYKQVVLRYFNPIGREITETISLDKNTDLHNIQLSNAIDYQWQVDVIRDHRSSIWSYPQIVDADRGIIDISMVWPNESMDSITIKYVKQCIFERYEE